MKRIFIGVAIVSISALVTVAQKSAASPQSKPNFSGTWELVTDRQTTDRILVINHSGDEVRFEDTIVDGPKTIVNKYTVFLDGRGEDNLIQHRGASTLTKIRSKTGWDKDKLVRRSRFESVMEMGSGQQVQSIHQEDQRYSLSADGNTLTVQINFRDETGFLNSSPKIGAAKVTYRRRT